MPIKNLKKNFKFFILISIVLVSMIVVFSAYDIYLDIKNRSPLLHTGVEGLTLSIMILGLLTLLWLHGKLNIKFINEIDKNLFQLNSKNRTLSKGISQKIRKQFLAWGLTKAESEVALLLIKGFSLKEISDLRNTAVSTIKEQASTIYSKTKLKNRTELSSFFLDDFLKIS